MALAPQDVLDRLGVHARQPPMDWANLDLTPRHGHVWPRIAPERERLLSFLCEQGGEEASLQENPQD